QARRPDDTLQGSASRQRLPHPPSTAGLDATPALRRAGLCPVAGEGAVRPGAQPARRSRRLSPGGSHQRARVGGHPRRGPVDARLAGRARRGDLLRCDLGHAHRSGGECVLGGQRLRPEHGSPPSLLGRGRDEPRAAGTRPDAVPPAARTRCVPQPTDRQPARSRHAWSSIRSPAVGIREVHNHLQRGGVRAARTGALQAQRAQARSGRHVPVLSRSHATARAGGRRRRQGRAGERAHFHLPREHHVDHLDDHQHRSPAHYDHAARNYDHLLLPGPDHLQHHLPLHPARPTAPPARPPPPHPPSHPPARPRPHPPPHHHAADPPHHHLPPRADHLHHHVHHHHPLAAAHHDHPAHDHHHHPRADHLHHLVHLHHHPSAAHHDHAAHDDNHHPHADDLHHRVHHHHHPPAAHHHHAAHDDHHHHHPADHHHHAH